MHLISSWSIYTILVSRKSFESAGRANLVFWKNTIFGRYHKRKTRSENFVLAKSYEASYEALECETEHIKGDLGRTHGMVKRKDWSNLKFHLLQNHQRLYAQFCGVDVDGFEVVGRHPFEVWAPSKESSVESESTDDTKLTADELELVLRKAETDVHALTQHERRELIDLWTQEVHDQALDDLFEEVRETDSIQRQLTNIHDEVDRRVLQDADVIGITTTGLAKRISTLQTCKMQGRDMRRGRGDHGTAYVVGATANDRAVYPDRRS